MDKRLSSINRWFEEQQDHYAIKSLIATAPKTIRITLSNTSIEAFRSSSAPSGMPDKRGMTAKHPRMKCSISINPR